MNEAILCNSCGQSIQGQLEAHATEQVALVRSSVGRSGGLARSAALSPAQRTESARRAAQARWSDRATLVAASRPLVKSGQGGVITAGGAR